MLSHGAGASSEPARVEGSVARLLMLGAAPGMRESSARVVETYRAHGLFTRWPIDYIATHGEAEGVRGLLLAQRALRELGVRLAQGPCLVHVHADVERGFWREAVFMATAIAARCPLMVHLRGAPGPGLQEGHGSVARTLMRLLLESAACVVAPCDSLRDWAGRLARRANLACIPDPVPLSEAPVPRAASNLVVFIGALDPAKGLFELLDALCAVRAAVPDVRLVCAGEGERAALVRHAAQLGIADAVRFTGRVGPSGKRALLESAAVFALPSYCEGLPLDLLEAMAAGVPVLATPVGGIAEVVVDGVSGFLAAPGDAATLARRMRSLLLDRAAAARIGAAGRETVRRRFSAPRALSRLEALYAQLGRR